MSFKAFEGDDFVVSADSITAPLWTGNQPTLTQFFTSSAQQASSTGQYFLTPRSKLARSFLSMSLHSSWLIVLSQPSGIGRFRLSSNLRRVCWGSMTWPTPIVQSKAGQRYGFNRAPSWCLIIAKALSLITF